MSNAITPHAPRISTQRTVELFEADFRHGPVFVDLEGTKLVLRDNIYVNFPDPKEKKAPFHLGWFGAIIVRASNVVVDLHGHTLAMHPAYRNKQRFFALVELSDSPLPKGKLGFDSEPSQVNDVIIRNGKLGETSHFGVHGVKCGSRIVIEDIEFSGYETGAISLTACRDLTVRRCVIGRPIRPKTSSDQAMLRDLADKASSQGLVSVSRRLRALLASPKFETPQFADALVRAIVLQPRFNVATPKMTPKEHRMHRISLYDIQCDNIHAEPRDVVGIEGLDGKAVTDSLGNLIRLQDAQSGSLISKSQALLSPEMPRVIRNALISGATSTFKPVYGMDLRGHELTHKASLYIRVDGCDKLSIRDVRCGIVKSVGPHSAAVGVMINDCTDVIIKHVSVGGVSVSETDSVLSDVRPQSGIYMRDVNNVQVQGYVYDSEQACSCCLRDVDRATLSQCSMRAPMVAHRTRNLSVDVD